MKNFGIFFKIILTFFKIIFHPAPSNFSISKNITSMELFSQPPQISPFQKTYLHGFFQPAPGIFPFHKKSYLHGYFQPAPAKFSILKNLTPMALFSQPSRIFPIKKSYLHAFSASPREIFHLKKSYPYGSVQPALTNFSN